MWRQLKAAAFGSGVVGACFSQEKSSGRALWLNELCETSVDSEMGPIVSGSIGSVASVSDVLSSEAGLSESGGNGVATAPGPAQLAGRDWFLLALPGLIWGASFLFIALGLDGFPPGVVTFLRIAIGFACLSVVPGATAPLAPGDNRRAILLGVLWMAFPFTLFPIAQKSVSSSVAGMLNGSIPIFAVLIAAGLAKRVPHRSVLWGLAVGVVGLVAIGAPTIGKSRASAVGVVLIITALVSYGAAINLAGPLQTRNGALPVIWRALGAALVLTAPFALWSSPRITGGWTPVLAMLALGGFGTGLAFVLATTLAGRFGASVASVTTFIEPVGALILGVAFRGDPLQAIAVLGCGVCLLGAWMVGRGDS